MDFLIIIKFLIFTIHFDFFRKQLLTIYIYTERKAGILEQRMRLMFMYATSRNL